MTPTQADDLVTPTHPCSPPTQHQEQAHQVPFNLGDAPDGLGPIHIHFKLGEPYDPNAPDIEPPAAQPPAHDCWGDSASSSDCDMEAELHACKHIPEFSHLSL